MSHPAPPEIGVIVVPEASQPKISLGDAGHQRLALVPGGASRAPVTLGCSWFTAGSTSHALRHDVDEFAYVVAGSGWIVNPAGAARAFAAGDGLVIMAGNWHAVRAGPDPVMMMFGFCANRPPATDRWADGTAHGSARVPSWWPATAVKCLEDLASYRLAGASECVGRIAEALVAVAETARGPADLVFERVAEVGGYFAALKPDTALYANVVARIARPLALAESGQDPARIVAERAAGIERERRTELDAVVAQAADLIDASGAIMIHDYSSTVMGVARRLAVCRGCTDFVVTAAEPLGAGARVARELTALGHRVTYCADTSAARLLPSASCYLTGVEAFYTDGSFANTVGTHGLALLAREWQVPVYAVAERLKGSGPPPAAANLSATLLGRWPQAGLLPEGIAVERHVLDLVPAGLVRAFVTASGPVAPDRMAAQLHPSGEARG
jgi:ribose 1,5-bisphosphate isomerase